MAFICIFVESHSNLKDVVGILTSILLAITEIILCCVFGGFLPREVERFCNELEWEFSKWSESRDEVRIKQNLEMIMILQIRDRISFKAFKKFSIRPSLLLSVGSIIITYAVIIIQTSL